MEKNRFETLCQEIETGERVMVGHPSTQEEGVILSCIRLTDTMVVRTLDGFSRSWDFHDCEDLTH